jgi:two-component system NtrC family sensor kinase
VSDADDSRDLQKRCADLAEQNRLLQERLLQNEKMVALGQLLAGVAHEINTPLAALASNNDLFIRTFAKLRAILTDPTTPAIVREHPQLARMLENIESLNVINHTATERIVTLVNSLRSFARIDQPEKDTVDIREGIESTLTLVHHELKNRITVIRDYQDIPLCSCHANQINQVLLNLLVNAAHAIDGKGTITIRLRQESNNLVIEVTDTGKGIPENIRDRIFEPGFTTKGTTMGTGLGLSIARRIVETHGGTISFDSEVGVGTTFRLQLPAAVC